MACFLECWQRPWQEDRTGTLPRPTWGRCLSLKLDAYRPTPSLSFRKLCLPPNTPINDGRRNSYTGPSGCRTPRSVCPGSEAPVIGMKLAGKPAKILAVYLSPSRPLIKSDLTACLSGGLPVLMAGNLNAKHVDWNFRLTALAWLRR